MQPNQNMNNMQNRTFNRTSAAPRPRPVQAPGYANPAVNNSNMAMNPGGNVVFQDKPKKSHASIYGMIFLAILAAGGIGFGVWSMLDSNAKLAKKDETIQDLNTQLANASQTTVEENETDVVINNNSDTSGPYIKDGIFYVPEWGLKFQIPSTLTNYGYSVDYDKAHVGYTQPSIGFTAMLASDEKEEAQSAYYDDIETCAIVSVSKEEGAWPETKQINGTIKQFDNYALLIWNYTRHGSCDHKLNIDTVQQEIQNMFANPENI